MKTSILVLLFSLFSITPQESKEKVYFQASDGLQITADYYIANQEYSFIILAHQGGSSRGEYAEVAGKLTKFRYNCLAIDLRSGDNSNYIPNETSRAAREQNISSSMLDAGKDIRAAIDFAFAKNPKEIILMGSGYSASLCMLEGKENPKVSAVIALSPGEFFANDFRMQDTLSTFEKPLLVTATKMEYPFVEQMLQNLPEDQYTLFQPSKAGSQPGARALWEKNETKDEFWLTLLVFINNLNR